MSLQQARGLNYAAIFSKVSYVANKEGKKYVYRSIRKWPIMSTGEKESVNSFPEFNH